MSDTASEPFVMKKLKGAKFGSLLLAYLSAGNNEDVAVLLRCTSLLTLTRGFTPLGLGAAQAASHASFTSSVRMVDRIHRRTTNSRSDALPAVTSRLTLLAEFVLIV